MVHILYNNIGNKTFLGNQRKLCSSFSQSTVLKQMKKESVGPWSISITKYTHEESLLPKFQAAYELHNYFGVPESGTFIETPCSSILGWEKKLVTTYFGK